MKQLWNVSVNDFKLVFRTPSLRVFLVLPILVFVIILVVLPWLISLYPVIGDYTAYIMMSAFTQTSTMYGFIYGMVLIDEKDTQVAKVYGVVPLSKQGFVLSRMVFPFLISTLFTWILLLLQPFFILPMLEGFILSLLVGLMFPVYVLGMAILSKNKMMGLTWIKVFNLLIVIPILAYFVPGSFAHIFGLIPTHWVFQGLNALVEGHGFWISICIGFVFFGGLLIALTRRFSMVHFA